LALTFATYGLVTWVAPLASRLSTDQNGLLALT
jgi:hypothetical protein